MIGLRGAIFQKLIANGNITSNVSEYLNYPAIFTVEPIPTDVNLPYIIVSQVSEVPNDTKTSDGRELLVDIRIYTQRNGNLNVLESLTEEVYQEFHNEIVVVDNFQNYLLRVVDIVNSDEEEAYGRIVSIRALFSKKIIK